MSGRQGFAVPAPVGAREVARRHYDRLWLWPTLRVADPALQDGSGMASRESRRGAPVRRRYPECEPRELKRVTAGARLSAPYGLPGRHSNERPPPLRPFAGGKTWKETKIRSASARENENACPLLHSFPRKRAPKCRGEPHPSEHSQLSSPRRRGPSNHRRCK